ncbi:rho guanine nucleotide exchange factor 5-like, partial [Cetorhinus maximus]
MRSWSAPPLGSPTPSPEGPGAARHCRSTGGSSRCRLRRQDAISTEGEEEDEVEAEEEEGAEEEGVEDEGSAVRGGSGRKPLAKSSSCPSPGWMPGLEFHRGGDALSGGNQLVEKRPSREWHRRGIRRPSMATSSSQDSLQDQRTDLESEDLPEMGEPSNLQARLSRRRSKILQSSSLLYQEYSHVTLDQEILRQKLELPAWGETPVSQDPVQRRARGPGTPRTHSTVRASISVPFSLWRDIPEVRKCSEFDRLSQDQQRLQEAKFELITSEASCLRSLDIAVEHFQHSHKLQEVLSSQDRHWLFSRISDVRDTSRRQNNPQFREVVEELESEPICQRLSLKSFLILPFQRITRLKLLVQ